jgi:hypothetical protein
MFKYSIATYEESMPSENTTQNNKHQFNKSKGMAIV